jgi:hypothetical protein
VDPDGRVGFLSDLQNLFANDIVPAWKKRFESLDDNAGLGETLITGALYGFANLGGSVATGLNATSNVVASSLSDDLIGGVKQDAQVELDATRQATSETFEALGKTAKIVKEDPSGTVKAVHAAAVGYTTAVMEGDRQAVAAIPKFLAESIALPPIGNGLQVAGQTSTKLAKGLAKQIADDMVSVPSGSLKAQRGAVSLSGLPQMKLPDRPEVQRHKSSSERRAYLNQKFGRTGDRNLDINVNGLKDHGFDQIGRAKVAKAMQNDQPIVLIGESMRRVHTMKSSLNRLGIETKTYSPRYFKGLSRSSKEANRSWLRYWTKIKNAFLIDLERDPSRRTRRSPFYTMESDSLSRWNYSSIFKPKIDY